VLRSCYLSFSERVSRMTVVKSRYGSKVFVVLFGFECNLRWQSSAFSSSGIGVA